MERRRFLNSAAASSFLLRGFQLKAADDTPALLGGSPVHRDKWPSWPIFNQAEENGLLDVLRSGL
ncbi:MAG: hypothetical protein U5J83_18980 [Bryobacterales bacterium]|nr:hypothetical protein [Bryobacterales bacterium]